MVLTLDEEANLARCLKSLHFCREIVIVDSGSQDRTLQIAEGFTDRIFRRALEGYGAQRNFGIEKAQFDWILWLDADEEISPLLAEQIKAIEAGSEFAGFLLNRKTRYLGRWIQHSGWYPQYVLRLFNRRSGRCSEAKVHERIILEGKTGRLKGDILHYAYRDISHHLAKLNHYTSLTAEERYAQGRRFNFLKASFAPPAEFLKKYILRLGFLDGSAGLAIAATSAYYAFLKEIKLFELSVKRKETERL